MHTVQLFERMLTCERRDGPTVRAKRGGKRGEVKGISSRSRYRLIKFLAKINRPDAPIFVTLTYREFTEDFEQWKAHLDNFRRAAAYYAPHLAGVWRLEFQRRGAPHYHILLWTGEERDRANWQSLFSRLWLKIIDQDTPANRDHGVTVELVNDFRKSAFYISVYQAKDAQDRDDILTGRTWGVWNPKALRSEPVETVDLSDSSARLFRRTLRRSYERFCRQGGRKVGNYSRGLRREQNFSSFLPYYAAKRLVEWCAAQDENPF